MYYKTGVNLIYEGQGVGENGSPVSLQITKYVACDEAENFSNQYYTEQQRNMRMSKNLIVPTHLTEDIIENGVRYELMYCTYNTILYKVRNVLKVRDTRQKMILDIQEVR